MVNLLKIPFFSMLLLVGYLIISYQLELIKTQYFVEPAENEALVLSQSSSFTSGSQNINEYISEGILPIYPDLFHKFSLLGDDKLIWLRSISIFSFWFTSVTLFFYSLLITRSSAISALLTLLFYGTASHSLYFMMARPDGLYIAFGSLSLILFGSLLHFQPKKEYLNFLGMVGVGSLSGLSLLSKQTGLFFFALMIFILVFKTFFKSKSKNNYKNLLYFLGSYFITLVSFFYFSPITYEFFLNGLTLYASQFSLTHVYKQIIDLFIYYWWLILISFMFIGDLLIKKKYKEVILWLGIWSIAFGVSIKLFGNDAAHFNNYIFFSITFFFMVTSLWSVFRFKRFCITILSLGALTSFFSLNLDSNQLKLESIHENYKTRIALNGPLENSSIFNYVKNNRGRYLTGRTDFILYFSGSQIIYEGSVLDAYFNQGRQTNNRFISKHLAEKRSDIHDKIENQFFDGIILGINDETIRNYPNIKAKYKKLDTQYVQSGDWPHTISLWVPIVK